MVQHVAHLTDVDDIEREVVEVAVTLVDECHHVMVAVDVKPHSAVAEVVTEPHAEDLVVKVALFVEVSGQEVDVAELARVTDDLVRDRARVRRQQGGRLAERHHLHAVALDIMEVETLVVRVHLHAERFDVCPGFLEPAGSGELVADVVQSWSFAEPELKPVRLVVTAQQRTVGIA